VADRALPWRTDSGNLLRDANDVLVGGMGSPELARFVVRAVNKLAEVHVETGELIARESHEE
jgi:hypothetical protein